VTIEQGLIQQFGGSPLFLELGQRLSALFRPGLLLTGRAGDGPAPIRRLRAAVGGRWLRHGRRRGDEAVRSAAAIFEDGGKLGLVWQLHSHDRLDLQNNKESFTLAIRLLFHIIRCMRAERYPGRSHIFDPWQRYQAHSFAPIKSLPSEIVPRCMPGVLL